jgi:hypothetical protein
MNIVTGESPENVARRIFIHLGPQCSLFFEELHQPDLPFISIIAAYQVRISGRTSYYENLLVEYEKDCRPHRRTSESSWSGFHPK